MDYCVLNMNTIVKVKKQVKHKTAKCNKAHASVKKVYKQNTDKPNGK